MNWLNIEQKIKVNVLLLIFKIKKNFYPINLSENLKYVKDIHNYNLRNVDVFRLNLYSNKRTKNMFFYQGLKLFNTIPPEIKNETNTHNFKTKLNLYAIENF